MTTPMVDTVRSIPLVVERDMCEPMEAETGDSGFPFEREDRDDHFRSQLDDIAKRHPEFAEHLEGFPFRSETLGRRRPPRPSDQEFHRFTNRPFGSGRFERFGFPFNDPFEEDLPQQTSAEPQPEPQSQNQPKEEERPKPERGRKQNIQQSNTVDLGQKQEPVNDRNQRSMSAPPPDNRQRYVSSIHIPINRDGGMGDMGKTQSQQQTQQQDKPVERVIPIHVEGRDEPVLPKHTGPSFSQPQSQPQPQPERIFGHSPSHFTQFVGPQKQPEWHHQGFGPEVRQQQKFQQTAPPPQQVPVQKPQEPKKEEKPKEEVPKANTPIDLIQSIQKDVSELMSQVENFAGMPRDKQYLYLDEMLTRNLIKLDNIDTQGQENIRQARKEAIKCIQSCINILEAKAAANVPQKPAEEKICEEKENVEQPFAAANPPEPQSVVEEKMDIEEKEKPVENQEKDRDQKVEIGGKGESEADKVEASAEKIEGANNPIEEKMEVVAEAAPVEEAPKEKSQESRVSETTDSKPDEEMTEAEPEESKQGEKEEETGDEKKEKKKGKKKVVKK